MTSQRPSPDARAPWRPLDFGLQVAALVPVAFMVVYPLVVADNIPTRIPRHFNLAGQPDAWADKSMLVLLPLLSLVLNLLFLAGILSPQIAKYRSIQLTKVNASAIHTVTRRTLLLTALTCNVLFAAIQFNMIRVGRGAPSILPGVMLLFAVLLVGGFILQRKALQRAAATSTSDS